ncbi:hypothetical protein J4E90_002229 [Alternaria incomplexa]|uniref:uncharacterized protein n=1 Tax=Alternaria incomplexa TaxID=1187928 RepID=UPI0022209375|nr:uncharacterized protein J4E90_002229 [Alternaria incomplexa]KAI4920089.1 hypothetical protein J4E90_002229 [Alternaria incomplexa]
MGCFCSTPFEANWNKTVEGKCFIKTSSPLTYSQTIELSALMKTADPTWDGVNLAIWSASELSVGILVASLPALRKQFDGFFRRILSSTFLGMGSKTGSGSNEIPLYNVEPPLTVGSRPTGGRSRFQRNDLDDGDSEKCILADSELPGKREITRTIVHEIRSENRSNVQAPDRVHNMYGQLQ